MDEFEDRLKRDAEKIRADISPELRLRIDASLHATEQIRPVPESGPALLPLPSPTSSSPALPVWWRIFGPSPVARSSTPCR